jgi:exonuclease SbcC
MIERIELVNFMSHPHTVLDLDQGLTVLVGENNSGKSAIVSALQVLCTNAQGDYMVRHGQKECLVRVRTSEGHTLEWKRKGRTVSYTVNGRDVHRLGGAVPEDLHELLRLPRVETENDVFDIHFGEQKEPIFLLNASPGKRATFFASSSDTIKLIEMQNLHKRKVQDAKWKEARLKQDVDRHQARLDRLDPVEGIGTRLDGLEKMHAGIRRDEDWMADLARDLRVLDKAGRDLDAARDISLAVRSLSAPPPLEDTRPLQALLAGLERQGGVIELEKSRERAMHRLQSPPALHDVAPVRGLISSLEDLNRQRSRNEDISKAVGPLQAPPMLVDTKHLKEMTERLGQTSQNLERQQVRLELLAHVAGPPELADIQQLQSLLRQMARLHGQGAREGQRAHVLQSLESPPEPFDLATMKKLVQEMDKGLESRSCRERVAKCLVSLAPPPEPLDAAGLQKDLDRLDKAGQQVQLRRQELERAGQGLDRAEQELREFVERIGVCPTCGQEMDPDSILQHEHARTTAPAWKGGG